MNHHTYLAGTLPSSPNATPTSVTPQLPPTNGNNFQFMSQSVDQFPRLSPATTLAKTPSLYHSQQHIGLVGDNNIGKNIESAYPIQQHISAETQAQHTWDMIQKQYDIGLVEPIGTSSPSSSPLSSVVKHHSPASRGATSINSTPPLYQEMTSPSTSSATSAQAMDTSQQTFHLQHPTHSQMLQVKTDNRIDNTTDAQQKLFFMGSGHSMLDTYSNTKSNEQQAPQQQPSNPKQTEREDQITQQQQQQKHLRQLHEACLSTNGSNLTSSSLLPSDLKRDQNATNPSNQQKLSSASASSNHHKAPDQHTKNDSCYGKRLHQDSSAATSKGLSTLSTKKPKTDTAIHQTISPQRKAQAPTPNPTSSSPLQPKPTPFTAAHFEHMSREKMVERLVFLENERLNLQQQQLEHAQQGQGMKYPKNISTDTASEDASGKNNGKTGGDDDDDDDDEVESISSGTEINATSDDKAEMKCLWKNCGIIRAGVRDLTDHIVSAHVGGGKPLYRCEWENCRRSHKPFTKRHKICNHLRVHTGERPFVCDKPGCEKRFSRLDSLTTHIKTHSTVRPFICHITGCEKAYYHARSLKKHLKLHEDEKAKEKELPNNNVDTSNSSNLNPPSVSFTASTSSSGLQSLQQSSQHPQQHHPYPFVEGISLPQFLLQPGSNITAASIRNEQMIDQSILDSAQSLFDPLSFQTLSALPMQHSQQQQQHPQPQPQFMQLGESMSQVTMPDSTGHSINMMDTIRQQQQQSNDGHQTGYNVSLPMVPGQPPMSHGGFSL